MVRIVWNLAESFGIIRNRRNCRHHSNWPVSFGIVWRHRRNRSESSGIVGPKNKENTSAYIHLLGSIAIQHDSDLCQMNSYDSLDGFSGLFQIISDDSELLRTILNDIFLFLTILKES